MKSNVKQSIAVWLALALFVSSFLSSFQIGIGTAEAADGLNNGEYPVGYRYLKDGTNDSSAAYSYLYVENSGKLIVQDGSFKLQHQIQPKYYKYFQYFGFRKAGASKAVINSATQQIQGMDGYQQVPVQDATDGSGNKVATIDVEALTQNPDLLMHIVIKDDPDYSPGFVYDYWYNVQLSIDLSTLPGFEGNNCNPGADTPMAITLPQLQTLVADAKSVTASTYEGTQLGAYPIGSRQPLLDKITMADNLIASSNVNSELIKEVYNALNSALNKYKYSINSVVDKQALREFLPIAMEDFANMHGAGYAECKEGFSYPPVTPGEYASFSTLKDSWQKNIINAQDVLTTVQASESDVTKAFNRLKDYQASKYIFTENPVKIIPLDSLNPTTVPSQNAPELSRTSVFINKVDGLDPLRANLTFIGVTPEELVKSEPDKLSKNNGASFSITGLDYNNEYYRAIPVLKSSDTQKKTYQVNIRRAGIQDQYWNGQSYISYKLNGVTKEIYISYNGNQLDALTRAADNAQTILQQATAQPGFEAAYQTAKTSLQAKIDAARSTAANLAATRPQITTASTALSDALTAFKVTVTYPLYFSAVDATKDTFSSMESYFLKPAVISTVGSVTYSTYASFTVKSSSIVKEFKVKTGGQLTDTQVVSQDTAADTRVVKFKVDDPAALVDASVHISIPAQNYDMTHSIRLNFNGVDNSALSQAISSANTLYRAAVVGTQPGQYPQAAKDALQAAINAAGLEATRLNGTSALSATALQTLQQAVNTFKASVLTQSDELTDGNYTIPFTIYKKGTDETSVMFDYVDKNSGKLTVAGGKKYVSFTLKQSEETKSFKTEVNGVLTETEIVSSDTAANTRIVRFEVPDLKSRLNGWVKIYWLLPPPIGLYDHEYDVELGFGTPVPAGVDKSELSGQIQTAEAKLAAAVEGSAVGQYATGSKAVLQTAIDQAKTVANNTAATQLIVNDAVVVLKKAIAIFLATVILENNNYTLSLPSTITDATGTPLTNFVSSNAGLKVSNGKQVASFTLVNGTTLKKVQVKKADGSREDVQLTAAAKQSGLVRVLSTDSTISFEVADRTAVYVLTLLDAQQTERAFEIGFSELTPVPVTNPGTGTYTGSSSSSGGGGGVIIKTLAETLKEGIYSIEYALYAKDTMQTSPANEYVKHPAKLEVKNGRSYAVVTLSSSAVSSVKLVGSDGSLNDPEVVSSNPGNNEKTIRFEVKYAANRVTAQFALIVAGKYDGKTFDADFAFDASSAQLVEAPATQTPNGQPASSSFADTQNHWAKTGIERAVALGLVNGYEDGRFRPDAAINRAEFTALLNRVLKLEQSSAPLSFSDADRIPDWVKPLLAPVVQAGIINGYEDGTFRADYKITRAELAVTIVRALKLDVSADAQVSFSDADSIPQWAKAEIAAAHKQGLISGRDNNLFAPNDSATRAEAITLILALQSKLEQK
ncbi:NEAT domain-containing protein [Paenibacillus thalictri]|uniref:NEAT domain-containing protein n=1 Tax=Paenibacillus thalictri TaxID=2527873 RepID=UPI0013EF3824|nr:NEAT domain-containing protein [Paenibacillus thalictri]